VLEKHISITKARPNSVLFIFMKTTGNLRFLQCT